ncbi:MAG: hypothetical protein HND52_17160 [Ignavibacteriae bacterium]|nr:hypothetical protein [Ignavibacteriota bacterium]NOG99691.1 hypothetical protein [Ignavibacteriota bacterium]
MNVKFLRISYLILISFFLINSYVYPCTTAIILGKYTSNGKPLLYKHRDAGFEQNKLMYFTDGKYNYIGLVNSVDSVGKEVWAGTNSAGFSIMNSASYNLKPADDSTDFADREGVIMKQALMQCATIKDFEKFLTELPKPLGVEANFGVIDAEGGAAYFETNNFDYIKVDVNEAPNGYIIRTNYSVTGDEDQGYGYIRHAQAEKLFENAVSEKSFSAEFLAQNISRCLKHGLTGKDLTEGNLPDENEKKFVHFEDFIPRNSSVTTVIIEGVAEGESADLTTMWTTLGFQLCSVSVPVWVAAGKNLPALLTADESGEAPLCTKALQLKEKCFPVKRGSGKRYLNVAALLNKQNSGIMQKLKPIEEKIKNEAEKNISGWEKNKFKKDEALKFYDWVNEFITNEYHINFGI